MFENFNNYDFFVLGFLLITTGFGFIRGLSGELCSLIKIVCASLISAYTVVTLKDMFFGGESGVISGIVLSLVPGTVFFVVNIILSMLLFPVKETIRAFIPFLLDRILGVVLAGAKNLLVIILIHIVLTVGFKTIFGKQIEWVSDAELSGVLNDGADLILETGVIQMFFSGKFTEDKGSSKSSKPDSSSPAKDLLDSFLGSEESNSDNNASDLNNSKEDTSESNTSIIDKINVFKKIYDSFDDSEKEVVKDAAIEKASDIDTNKLKELIDGLKN